LEEDVSLKQRCFPVMIKSVEGVKKAHILQ